MKAEELRIGNLVLKQDVYEKWNETAIDSNDIYACIIYPESFEGIPLSPEWLQRAGFVRKSDLGDNVFDYRTEGRPGKQHAIQTNGKDFVFIGYHDGVDITYVHQLQNLYCALTQTELTFNQP